MSDDATRILAINVGNTSVSYGVFTPSETPRAIVAPCASIDAIVAGVVDALSDPADAERTSIVLAGVNPPVSERLIAAIEAATGREAHRIGVDIPVPMRHSLAEHHTTGDDRLLNAYAAFRSVQQACIIVDAGTAITIDFVDGVGVFHGGAIAPGTAMMLRSMHEHTAQLPEVAFERPDAEQVFPKTTPQAMLSGVYYGVRGMVRAIVERYAEGYGAYPKIIATGGDATRLFEDDELIERIEPDLTLRGVVLAAFAALAPDEAETF